MRCLLDKVTARHIMESMLKLGEGRSATSTDLLALYFYQRAHSCNITLFILPQTYNLLKRLNHLLNAPNLLEFKMTRTEQGRNTFKIEEKQHVSVDRENYDPTRHHPNYSQRQ